MKGWRNESGRHSLASRGVKSKKMDLKLPKFESFSHHPTEYLTNKQKKEMLDLKTVGEVSNYVAKNEARIAEQRNRMFKENWGDYLTCDEVVEIISQVLIWKEIPHEIIIGLNDRGDSHNWIRDMKGRSYDPTSQGIHEGQIEARFIPGKGMDHDFKYIDPDDADPQDEKSWNEYRKNVVVP